jgi:hypothetical protein
MSEGGMSVVSPLELPANESVEVEFTLPNTRTVMRLKSVVRNRIGSRYGIEFLSATEGQCAEIRKAGEAALATQDRPAM